MSPSQPSVLPITRPIAVRREPGLRIVPEQKAGRLVGLEEALSRNAKHPRRFAPC